MNFTNKQKMYFNVFLLFIFSYFLASKVIYGIKTQDFNYVRIGLNVIVIFFTIKNINKYNTEDQIEF